MALFAVARRRWSERVHQWWEEYYTDNPVVWELQRRKVRMWQAFRDDPTVRVLPLWTRWRTRWAIVWWLLALLGIAVFAYDAALKQQVAQFINGLACQPLTLVLIAGIIPVGWMSYTEPAAGFLDRMRETQHHVALGMTRLRGNHFVNGCLLNSVLCGSLMRGLIAYLPLLWLLQFVQTGSWFWGALAAVAGIVLWLGVIALLQLLATVTMPAKTTVREATANPQQATQERAVAAQMLSMLIIPVALIILLKGKWFVIVAALMLWVLTLALYGAAVYRVERCLRSPEPIVLPSEGR